MFMQETYFTDEQEERLFKLCDHDMNKVKMFNEAITPTIYYSSLNELSEKQKKGLERSALKSGKKFRDDIEKNGLLWNLIWFSEEGFEEILALNSLIDRLKKPFNKGHSQYKPIAAAAGRSMTKANMKVSGSYSSTTADIIEICIEAAGLPETGNMKELAQVAKKAADSFSSK